MSSPAPARPWSRRTSRRTVVGLVAITAAIVATLVQQSASSSAPSVSDLLGDSGGQPAEDHGVLPDGVTIVDDEYPGISNLHPRLRRAAREATTAAADDGVELYVTSGWRSPEYQERLLREAVATYGSAAEAARWVATADTSAHVSGDAIDIGPSAARAWLSDRGYAYGLCQIYRNEPWHYELRPAARRRGCPPQYADPTADPRMQ